MSSTEARARASTLRHTPSRTAPRTATPADFARQGPRQGQKPQAPAPSIPQIAPNTPAPIIPPHSIAGRALLAVIAIMSFLSALTLGAVVLVRSAAIDWQGQVSRELTIQVRPVEGRDIEADVAHAAKIARATPGVAQVRPYTREESARLLEPWLGAGLSVAELPIPRLIVVSLAPGSAPDFERLRLRLAAETPNASLDDHRAFVERMRAMTGAAVALGTAILALMLAATVLLVAFATRGAMATNRAIVEVLHFVGAKNRYISGQFQRHFLLLGLKGAAIGGGAAIALFLLAGQFGPHLLAPTGAPEAKALSGGLALSASGYAGILGLLVLVAAVTAIASRWTVQRTLGSMG